MKIVIIHGDDITKSRDRYYQIISGIKQRGWDIIKYEDKSQTLADILTSQSLFGSEILAVSDFTCITDQDLKWLKQKHKNFPSMFLVYSKKKLTKTAINKFPNPKIEEFSLPVILFKFLDSLYPDNTQQTVQLLNELLKQVDIEFVFIMLARTFRDLLLVKSNPKTDVYPVWRISKLTYQADKYKNKELENVINYLSALDLKVKTGKTDPLTGLTLLFAKNYQSL